MKKLAIVLGVVAMAAVSQAAAFNWNCTSANKGVTLSSLNGNGNYDADGSLLYNNSAISYVIKTYDSTGTTQLGEAKGTVTFNAQSKIAMKNIAIGDTFVVGTTYNYVIELTGTQTDMTSYSSDTWDYSNAKIAATVSGTFTGKTGTQLIASTAPISWTVSGAKQKEEPVPEPTSAMLMLLGMAGLALKRKRA